ncbi:hypothetical protein HRG84_06010 [Flavisolibacter sp. BT320]|nr:hypothetical protein [Flavisolibacter longurius]
MQDKRKETDRSTTQPGAMDSYNNREDNRPGRVEETRESEQEEAKIDEINKHPNHNTKPEEE